MGHREVKRVPLDFHWPMTQAWKGYLNPFAKKCPDCEGYGATTGYRRLSDFTRLMVLSACNAKSGTQHPYFNDDAWGSGHQVTSRDFAELMEGLAGGEISHYGDKEWQIQKAILKAAGMPEDWGTCPTCKEGDGIHPDFRERYEQWQEYEPPEGPGWQMWETVSEGSPISPVFETPEELANWCAVNATIFAGYKVTAEAWLTMIVEDQVEVGSMFITKKEEGKVTFMGLAALEEGFRE